MGEKRRKQAPYKIASLERRKTGAHTPLCRAVQPMRSTASTLASFSSNNETASMCPYATASISGVLGGEINQAFKKKIGENKQNPSLPEGGHLSLPSVFPLNNCLIFSECPSLLYAARNKLSPSLISEGHLEWCQWNDQYRCDRGRLLLKLSMLIPSFSKLCGIHQIITE